MVESTGARNNLRFLKVPPGGQEQAKELFKEVFIEKLPNLPTNRDRAYLLTALLDSYQYAFIDHFKQFDYLTFVISEVDTPKVQWLKIKVLKDKSRLRLKYRANMDGVTRIDGIKRIKDVVMRKKRELKKNTIRDVLLQIADDEINEVMQDAFGEANDKSNSPTKALEEIKAQRNSVGPCYITERYSIFFDLYHIVKRPDGLTHLLHNKKTLISVLQNIFGLFDTGSNSITRSDYLKSYILVAQVLLDKTFKSSELSNHVKRKFENFQSDSISFDDFAIFLEADIKSLV